MGKTAQMPLDLSHTPPVDALGVEQRIARLAGRSLKGASKVRALTLALSMLDLTTLEGADTPGKVIQLCRKAVTPCPQLADLPSVAAVCVYPELVHVARKALTGSKVHIAAVATGFPSGQYPLALRLEDVRRAVEAGADEIDMVISRGRFLCGELGFVYDEIAATKEACGSAHLKVILETGELGTLDNVRRASDLAMQAGADFIKTSTGKVQPAATLQVTLVMLQAIRDFHAATGRMVGMKPAGGIRTSTQAIQYLILLRETLGEAWLTADWFRFGASALANDILMQLLKERLGAYVSPRQISND